MNIILNLAITSTFIKNDKLYYKPLNLQIIPKDDEERKQIILKKHFHGPEKVKIIFITTFCRSIWASLATT